MKTRTFSVCALIAVITLLALLMPGGVQPTAAQGPLPSKSPFPPPPIQPVNKAVAPKRNPASASGNVFTVPATAQWENTGLNFNVGDSLTITATGSWCPGSPATCPVGPDGSSTQWPDNFLNLTDIGVCAYCATTNTPYWAALIAYIGSAPPPAGSYTSTSILSEAQKIFVVGSNYSGTAANTGTLWLNFNDDAYSNATGDNSGQVTATVSSGATPYSISGRVTDGSNNPISGVIISDGVGDTAPTDSSGNYTLSGLAAGNYTLSATMTGHKFWPPSSTVSLSANTTLNFSEWTCSMNVPLYLQTAAAWNQPGQTYAGSSYTIGQAGCALSSDAMMLSYFGQMYSPPFQTNPGALNTALLNFPNGFSELNVNPISFQSYARSKGVWIFQTGTGQDNSTDRQKLEQVYLCSGNPAILQVASPWSSTGSHFVVATGKTMINSQNTYTLNDPVFGSVTLLEKYNNHFTSVFYYINELTASTYHRTLEISAHSPVQLLVTDALGRRVGYDPRTSTSYNEIPNAGYVTGAIVGPDGSSLPDFKYVLISQITNGPYTVQAIGTGSGPYTIDALQADSSGNTSITTQSGTAQLNSVNTFTVTTSSFLFLPFIAR